MRVAVGEWFRWPRTPHLNPLPLSKGRGEKGYAECAVNSRMYFPLRLTINGPARCGMIRFNPVKGRWPQRGFTPFNAAKISILFAFVFSRRHDAIVYCIRVKHYRDEVKEKETDAEAGRCDRRQKYENSHGDRSGHPQKTCEFMSFVDMAQTRNDA